MKIGVYLEKYGKYTYETGDLTVEVGDRVMVPFGSRTKEGTVQSLDSYYVGSVKQILSVTREYDAVCV